MRDVHELKLYSLLLLAIFAMSKMLSLKVYLSERLTAAAEEIFGEVEKTIAEYKKEISRVRDLEIISLKMQLKRLKSDPELCLGPQHQQQTDHDQNPSSNQSDPSVESALCQEDQNHPDPSSQVKEQQGSHVWTAPDTEHMESLDLDHKDFILSPSSLKSRLGDHALPFYLYHTHTGEGKDKPHSCSVCEKRFNNWSHLAAHIRTHTGERPYRCDICRKTFITTSALNRHQTIHTEGKQFMCSFCGKSFKWMESLGRHMRSVHKREDMPV